VAGVAPAVARITSEPWRRWPPNVQIGGAGSTDVASAATSSSHARPLLLHQWTGEGAFPCLGIAGVRYAVYTSKISFVQPIRKHLDTRDT